MSTPYGPAEPESASEPDATPAAESAATPAAEPDATPPPPPAAGSATASAESASAPTSDMSDAADAERPVVVVPPVEGANSTPPSDPAPAAQTYYRPSLPANGNQMIMRPTSQVHGILRGGLAVLLVIAGVVNLFWGGRFPSSAIVEQIFVFGISVDMFAAAITLGIFAILAIARRSVPVKPLSTSPMSVAAIAMAGVVFLAWALLNLLPVLASVSAGERYQYMTAVGAIFILGIPWTLSLIFGTLSLRSGGRLTGILGTIAIVLGFILVIAAVTSSVLYGLGLTN